MSIPTHKTELIDAIEDTFSKLMGDLETVPDKNAFDQELPGHAKGSVMSVADLVAYLIGWNELVLKWLDQWKADQDIVFPDTGFQWNELGLLAQKFYTDYQNCPIATVSHA